MSARRAYFSIPLAVKTDRPQKVVTKLQKKKGFLIRVDVFFIKNLTLFF